MQIKLIDSRDYYRYDEDDGFERTWFDDEMLEEDMESLFGNKEGNFIVVGYTGRWDGKHGGYFDKVFDTLKEAIEATFLNGQFEFDVRLEFDINLRSYYDYLQGRFSPKIGMFTYGSHHDGTNCFHIMELTEDGYEMFNEWIELDEILEDGEWNEVDYL